MPPRVQLKLYVYRLLALQSTLMIIWLVDPRSWRGTFDRNTRNTLVRAARIVNIVAWLFIVLFWQESYNLAKTFRQMRGFRYWRKVLIISVGLAVVVVVPLLVLNSTVCVVDDQATLYVYNALFATYGLALGSAGVVYVMRLTRYLAALDRRDSTSSWLHFVLQMRCVTVWAVVVLLMQLGCAAWYVGSKLTERQFLVHSYLTHFGEVLLSFLALLAVYSPSPKSAGAIALPSLRLGIVGSLLLMVAW